MDIVASNKKVLEINETYRHWQQPVGGKDEAHDATASGGGGQGGGPISAQPQKGEEFDLGRVGGADGIQSRLCETSAAPTRSTTEAREAIVGSGCATARSAGPRAVLRREGESGANQDLESDGLHLRQAYAAGFSRDGASIGAPQRTALRSQHQGEVIANQCGHHRSAAAHRAAQVRVARESAHEARDVTETSDPDSYVCGMG